MQRFTFFGCAALIAMAFGGQLIAAASAQSPEPPSGSGQYCITVVGEPPAEGWDAVSLAQAVTDQTAYLIFVEAPDACATAADPATTPEPVETPEATPVAGAPYDAYVAAISPSLFGLVAWTESLSGDAHDGNLHALKNDFSHLRSLSQKALRWMGSHEPQPCYAELYADEKQVFTLILNSATHGLRGLAHYSISEINRSSNLLEQATTTIVSITDNDEVVNATAACASDPGFAG